MIADLDENYGLVGMKQASVHELLGTPIHEGPRDGGRVLYYRIAPGPFLDIDSTYLHVFISSDKVVRYEVYTYSCPDKFCPSRRGIPLWVPVAGRHKALPLHGQNFSGYL